MSGTRRWLILGGLLFACGPAVAAEPDKVYVSGGYHWAPGYYAGGVYHAAPAYYYFAPGYYTPAPRTVGGGRTVTGDTAFPSLPSADYRVTRVSPRPSPAGVGTSGRVGYYARQRTPQGLNPNYYHGYLHPRADDLGGP